jgi:DNA-binding IscR family transcriptional regulator
MSLKENDSGSVSLGSNPSPAASPKFRCVTRCIMLNRACGTDTPCALHEAWEQDQQAILRYLETQTLNAFVEKTASKRLPFET